LPAPKRKLSPTRASKIIWPAADVLEKLIWEKPTSQIAKDLGVSDKAVEKHCKKLGLKKPPRGHWAKIQAKVKTPDAVLEKNQVEEKS
jgi:FixJ family two-component response regulator